MSPIVKHFKVWGEVNNVVIEHDANLIVVW